MCIHKDISTYILFKCKKRHKNKHRRKITPFFFFQWRRDLRQRMNLFPTQPCCVFPLLRIRRSAVQTQLKVSSIPVSRSMLGPSSQILMYAFLYAALHHSPFACNGQPVNHRPPPPLSHGAQEQRWGGGRMEWEWRKRR